MNSRHGPLSTSVLSLAIALLIACGENEATNDWVGTIEQLPNGVMQITNPPNGLWASGNAWTLDSVVVVGETDGDGPAVFGSISALQVGPDGSIYILDRQANELRIFDPAGAHVRSVGRTGEGPGEFISANGLAWLSEDSLLVIDQEGDRHTILNLNGDYIRSVPRRLGWGTFVFRGGIVEDRVYEFWTIESGQTAYPILVGTRVRGDNPPARIAAGGSEAMETSMQADTVFLPSPDGPIHEAFSIRTAQRGMVIRVPFTGAPQYHLDGQGNLWSGHGGTARLYRTTLEGDTLAEITFQFDPAPVSAEEIAEWEKQPAIDRFKSLGGTLERDRIPATKPYFDGIITDQENNTWLTIPAAPSIAAFAVFDPQGRYLGPLHVTGIERDEYVPPVVRNNRLHFVGRDTLDVQRVYVYRVNER